VNGEVVSEVEKDANGNETKLTCRKRLGIFYAASSANYVHSFYEDENAGYSKVVHAWAGITDKMYFWIYQLNFNNFLYPYNSFDSLAENMRYFKSVGGTYMYNQGTWYNPNNSGFCKLRDYLGSKLMFNVNLNYEDLVDKYFKYYFGEAEPYMREFFDTVQANSRDKESTITGSVFSSTIKDSSVWPEGMINSFMDLIDQSYAAIESHKEINTVEYEALQKHILIESLFPRFSLCTTYASSYTDSELLAMRLAFKADFTTLKNTADVEWYTIQDRYDEWGI
jgi:hypothetical protein